MKQSNKGGIGIVTASEQDMQIGIHEVDTDRDRLIDREEFIEWWSED